jgi:hypothetical protein
MPREIHEAVRDGVRGASRAGLASSAALKEGKAL